MAKTTRRDNGNDGGNGDEQRVSVPEADLSALLTDVSRDTEIQADLIAGQLRLAHRTEQLEAGQAELRAALTSPSHAGVAPTSLTFRESLYIAAFQRFIDWTTTIVPSGVTATEDDIEDGFNPQKMTIAALITHDGWAAPCRLIDSETWAAWAAIECWTLVDAALMEFEQQNRRRPPGKSPATR